MTIDEAIRYCVEVAEEQEELYRICPASESEMSHCNGTKDCRVLKNGKNKGCQKCAEEHRQLAEWLEELKAYKSDDFTKNLQILVYKQCYNKAIDDFVENISLKISVNSPKDNSFNDTSDKIVDYVINTVNKIAEQLKAGGEE